MAANTITPPDARSLLPPLLACLPTAFVSPHPPPALLPQLSPILRQRVSLLSGNTSSGNGGWLSLLSWDTQRASKLGQHLEGVQFEAHPVSGELELDEVSEIQYRRLDAETLQSRLHISEFSLLPIYVWISQSAEEAAGWKLAELRILEDSEDGTEWVSSIAEANESLPDRKPAPAQAIAAPQKPAPRHEQEEEEEEDDDDYWASYDRTPGPTPGRTPAKRSPAPQAPSTSNIQVGPTAEELQYFARYANEVQPALDSHDPDEENTGITGGSTLQGDELTRAAAASNNPAPLSQQQQQKSFYESDPTPPYTSTPPRPLDDALEAPRATSPSSQGSVERLERMVTATEENPSGAPAIRAEVGVRQFIGTEIKSLFRLARSVGMERAEFGELVQRELEVLGFMEVDD